MDSTLQELLQQEKELQFDSFNEETAWKIGSWLRKKAQDENLPIAIDITRGEQQLFHASLPGASADNDGWIKRKVKLVRRVNHSSYYIGRLLKSKGQSIEEKMLLPESEYAPHGGCFPIFVKDTGPVGTITVSGLIQQDDHNLVVEAIRWYLNK